MINKDDTKVIYKEIDLLGTMLDEKIRMVEDVTKTWRLLKIEKERMLTNPLRRAVKLLMFAELPVSIDEIRGAIDHGC